MSYKAVAVANGGAVVGSVRLEGEVPASAVVPVSKDRKVCGSKIADQSAAVNSEGGVQWAFAYLEGVTQGKAFPAGLAEVNNVGCAFSPYVQGAAVGGKLRVLNSDPILHNVHSYRGRRTLWNLGLPIKGAKYTRDLPDAPGVIEFRCDVHEWMKGKVYVMAHPYFATTDDAGAFRIEDVPPGTYTLVVEHSRWGTSERRVTVAAGQNVMIDVDLVGGSSGSGSSH